MIRTAYSYQLGFPVFCSCTGPRPEANKAKLVNPSLERGYGFVQETEDQADPGAGARQTVEESEQRKVDRFFRRPFPREGPSV